MSISRRSLPDNTYSFDQSLPRRVSRETGRALEQARQELLLRLLDVRGNAEIGIEAAHGRGAARLAIIQAEDEVQLEKMKSVGTLTREAMSDYFRMRQMAQAMAAYDRDLYDDLRFFTDLQRFGSGEIVSDTISAYCRESRRA